MLASQVRLSELNTWDECYLAVKQIEDDHRNIIGGITAWNSGRETHLKAGAQNKINALDAKMVRLDPESM